MFKISPNAFLDLNDETGYETLRINVGGLSPYERGVALHRYLWKNAKLTSAQMHDKENLHIFVEMEVMKWAKQFRNDVHPAFLSPKQFTYVAEKTFRKLTTEAMLMRMDEACREVLNKIAS
jgi:hypothetical protein